MLETTVSTEPESYCLTSNLEINSAATSVRNKANSFIIKTTQCVTEDKNRSPECSSVIMRKLLAGFYSQPLITGDKQGTADIAWGETRFQFIAEIT